MSNHNILVGKYCGVDLGTVIDSIPEIPFKLFCIRYPCYIQFSSRVLLNTKKNKTAIRVGKCTIRIP